MGELEGGQIERTFFGGSIPGLQVNACQGATVKVIFNVVMQTETDTLRKFARWIEEANLQGEEVAR